MTICMALETNHIRTPALRQKTLTRIDLEGCLGVAVGQQIGFWLGTTVGSAYPDRNLVLLVVG